MDSLCEKITFMQITLYTVAVKKSYFLKKENDAKKMNDCHHCSSARKVEIFFHEEVFTWWWWLYTLFLESPSSNSFTFRRQNCRKKMMWCQHIHISLFSLLFILSYHSIFPCQLVSYRFHFNNLVRKYLKRLRKDQSREYILTTLGRPPSWF